MSPAAENPASENPVREAPARDSPAGETPVAAALAIAVRVAATGADVAMLHFRPHGVEGRHKADGTIVTDADIAAEAAILDELRRLAPGEPVVGEETAADGDAGGSGRIWIVDPIDGTENFSRGVPMWGTLVACQDAGRVIAAAVIAPALHRRWWAGRGAGAFSCAGPLAVSTRRSRDKATISIGGLHEYPPDVWSAVTRLAGGFRAAWGLGNFLGHAFVAEGVLDMAISYGTSVWDVAPLTLLVAEAGGRWSALDGAQRMVAGSLLTSNGPLHERAVADLAAGDACSGGAQAGPPDA